MAKIEQAPPPLSSRHPLVEETPSVALDVLGYRDEGEWVALALDMDLRGYGDSFGEAFEELRELVAMQISFALQKAQPEMIWRPADPVWFERFASARQDLLATVLTPERRAGAEFFAAGLEIPSAHVIEEAGKGFALANA